MQHKFVNYALQFQWALDNIPITAEWVMRIDADETLTPKLIDEIRRRLPTLSPEITGVNDTVSLGGAPAEVRGDVHALSTSAPRTTPAARKV